MCTFGDTVCLGLRHLYLRVCIAFHIPFQDSSSIAHMSLESYGGHLGNYVFYNMLVSVSHLDGGSHFATSSCSVHMVAGPPFQWRFDSWGVYIQPYVSEQIVHALYLARTCSGVCALSCMRACTLIDSGTIVVGTCAARMFVWYRSCCVVQELSCAYACVCACVRADIVES